MSIFRQEITITADAANKTASILQKLIIKGDSLITNNNEKEILQVIDALLDAGRIVIKE